MAEQGIYRLMLDMRQREPGEQDKEVGRGTETEVEEKAVKLSKAMHSLGLDQDARDFAADVYVLTPDGKQQWFRQVRIK